MEERMEKNMAYIYFSDSYPSFEYKIKQDL